MVKVIIRHMKNLVLKIHSNNTEFPQWCGRWLRIDNDGDDGEMDVSFLSGEMDVDLLMVLTVDYV